MAAAGAAVWDCALADRVVGGDGGHTRECRRRHGQDGQQLARGRHGRGRRGRGRRVGGPTRGGGAVTGVCQPSDSPVAGRRGWPIAETARAHVDAPAVAARSDARVAAAAEVAATGGTVAARRRGGAGGAARGRAGRPRVDPPRGGEPRGRCAGRRRRDRYAQGRGARGGRRRGQWRGGLGGLGRRRVWSGVRGTLLVGKKKSPGCFRGRAFSFLNRFRVAAPPIDPTRPPPARLPPRCRRRGGRRRPPIARRQPFLAPASACAARRGAPWKHRTIGGGR